MSKLSPARSAALAALLEADRSGAFVRDLMDELPCARSLDRRDAAFALRLALGVSATKGCLDEALDAYVAKPGKVQRSIRMALRIAAFEIIYLGSEPRVAVSQGAELVRSRAKSAVGFANAVLRRVAEGREAYLAASDIATDERAVVSKARRAGVPAWLAREMLASMGDAHAQAALDAQLEPAPLAIQLNPRVSSIEGVELYDTPLVGAFRVLDRAGLVGSGALGRDDAASSDLNAQIIATAAIRPGSTLEIGAGRGTKTFVMGCGRSRMGLAAQHVACDLSAHKCDLNRSRIIGAGLDQGISFAAGDCRDLGEVLSQLDSGAGERLLFDTVFLDAPCSGTGTMRRHPEIPWRLQLDDVVSSLPELQLELLAEASSRVAPSGELIYATCSILEAENDRVVERFLEMPQARGFQLAPVSESYAYTLPVFEHASAYVRDHETETGCFMTYPAHDAFDGHFCARFIRIA